MRLLGSDLVAVLAQPRCVAVVGASADPDRISGRPVEYLRRYGFGGGIVPVNARHRVIGGIPAVARLSEVEPGSVDAALIAVPAASVVAALADAEQIGVEVAVVIGSGFEDRASPERRDLERFVADSRMRVVGPNCVGTVGAHHAAFLTFSSVLRAEQPRPGRVGLVTQSGALGNSLLQTLIRRHVGLSQWISSGDEVDVGALELTVGLLSQDGTDAVGLFLEGISDLDWLPRLEDVLRGGGKRLFVLKAANTSAGRQAAAGHTGRIVGSAAASQAILREVGAREVSSLSALADALVVAGTCPTLVRTPQSRAALVSISGAAGVIGSDRVARHRQLTMAPIGPAAATRLASRLDARLHPANPLDVPFIDDTAAFAGAVTAYAVSDVADVVLAVESGLAHDRQELSAKLISAQHETAVVLTSLSEDDQIPSDIAATLALAGIAYLPTVERAVDAVAACVDAGLPPARPVGEHDDASLGLEWAATRLPADFPWAPWRVVANAAELDLAMTELGLPIVLKAAGRTIAHRTEFGAVRIVRDSAAAARVLEELRAICDPAGDAVLAQQFVPGGFEVLVSAVRDREYGPVAYVRPGGTYVESMSGQAVVWGGWPRAQRDRVLRESSIGALLDGYRGGTAYDLAAFGDLIATALGAVAADISFVEMNPVIIGTSGVRVVDLIARE
ncbi:acetate--CoA ligase family protein [Dactylosporangium sp. CA-233914]|uniref:acetate--CoA ligase family protein n=1 Tax=Dactylosporangium sp. CA-233914 TaxID=3239934 RepID=UPI003D90657F